MHGNVNVFLFIVPLKMHTAIGAAGPVDGALVVGLYGRNKVFCVSVGEVFDAKVIDAESNVVFLDRCFQTPGVCCSGASP